MKKLLSAVLVLAMLASMAIYFPMGAVAAEPEQTNNESSNVLFEENFDDYAAGDYTAVTLAELLGWTSFTDRAGAEYQITEDGKLRLYVPYQDPSVDDPYDPATGTGTTKKMHGRVNANIATLEGVAGQRVVVEFEKTYEEQFTAKTFYAALTLSVDDKNYLELTNNSMQGFMINRAYYGGAWKYLNTQIYPDKVAYNQYTTDYNKDPNGVWNYDGYKVGDNYGTEGGDARTIFGSTDNYKVVIDPVQGVDIYVNGNLAQSQLGGDYWQNTLYSAVVGQKLGITVCPGVDVTFDNIKVYTEDEDAGVRDLVITEINSAGGSAGGAYEYAEVYNNSGKPVNIYDYVFVRDSDWASNNGSWSANTFTGASNDYGYIIPGVYTWVSQKQSQNTATLINPKYEEGWLQPGEVALLWTATDTIPFNTADVKYGNGLVLDESLYNNPDYTDANGNTIPLPVNTYANNAESVDAKKDFREAWGLADDVKAFYMGNTGGWAFNNSGIWLYGLYKQPGIYDQTTGKLDTIELIGTKCKQSDDSVGLLTSWVLYYHNKKTVDGASVDVESYAVQNETILTVAAGSSGKSAHYHYRDGAARSGTLIGTTSTTSTPGTITDEQKRVIDVTVDGVASEVYLGETVTYGTYTDDAQFLYAKVNGETTTEKSFTALSDTDVETVSVSIVTLEGAAVRTSEPTGLRWQTAVDKTDFDALKALESAGEVKSVEIGTVIIRDEDLGDAAAPTLEMVGDNCKKVVANSNYWYEENPTAESGYGEFTDDYIFAGSVVGITNTEHYTLNYSAVGYLTVTLADDTVITVYGGYNAADHSRTIAEVAYAAVNDPDNGLTAEQIAAIQVFANYYTPNGN